MPRLSPDSRICFRSSEAARKSSTGESGLIQLLAPLPVSGVVAGGVAVKGANRRQGTLFSTLPACADNSGEASQHFVSRGVGFSVAIESSMVGDRESPYPAKSV